MPMHLAHTNELLLDLGHNALGLDIEGHETAWEVNIRSYVLLVPVVPLRDQFVPRHRVSQPEAVKERPRRDFPAHAVPVALLPIHLSQSRGGYRFHQMAMLVHYVCNVRDQRQEGVANEHLVIVPQVRLSVALGNLVVEELWQLSFACDSPAHCVGYGHDIHQHGRGQAVVQHERSFEHRRLAKSRIRHHLEPPFRFLVFGLIDELLALLVHERMHRQDP
mmetsp:Transcript_27247/g.64718  ORF Transcript_27247/g.64718 Transcript_27247/m.64718 type:complete len:220 (-) Transcript_27247:446-1105(-)